VGALLAVTLCYAGGNVGDVPGWWVVILSAALSTGTLLVAWLTLTGTAPIVDAVTVDRDPAAGLRLGAFLVLCAAQRVYGLGRRGSPGESSSYRILTER
jgi:hypothetical protein